MSLSPATSRGGGLPSQWTDGGHGNVTASVDTTTAVPLTIAPPDSSGARDGHLVLVTDEVVGTSACVLEVAQSVRRGGNALAEFYDTGELDLTQRDPTGGTGLRVTGIASNPGGSLATFASSFVGNTGELLTLTQSGGVGLLFGSKGLRLTGLTAAPADADLAASYLSLWLDATPGATALKVKTADSGGTIVSQTMEQASPITSGALPTLAIVSGTGRQVLVARAAETVTPFTGDGTNNAATCAIALSPDNVTYSTLATISIAAALNLTGVLTDNVNVRVPAGWYIKLTAVHGTLGTTTYY